MSDEHLLPEGELLVFTHRGQPYTIYLREMTETDSLDADKQNFTSYRGLFRFLIKRLFMGGDEEVVANSELLDKAAYVFRLELEAARREQAKNQSQP